MAIAFIHLLEMANEQKNSERRIKKIKTYYDNDAIRPGKAIIKKRFF